MTRVLIYNKGNGKIFNTIDIENDSRFPRDKSLEEYLELAEGMYRHNLDKNHEEDINNRQMIIKALSVEDYIAERESLFEEKIKTGVIDHFEELKKR